MPFKSLVSHFGPGAVAFTRHGNEAAPVADRQLHCMVVAQLGGLNLPTIRAWGLGVHTLFELSGFRLFSG